MQDDLELIEEILDGSKAGMEVLVNKYYKMIFAYIYRNTGEYHTSYDLTQEVFIKMMKAITRFDCSMGSFKNWIFKIALNTVKDYFKGNNYRGYTEAIELDENKADQIDGDNVVEMITRMDKREEVKKAIMELPGFQREVVILRFYHDMKMKDIAIVTETNESTVKSRLKQGIEKLRISLKNGAESNEAGYGI